MRNSPSLLELVWPESLNEIGGECLNLKVGQEAFKSTPTNQKEALEEEEESEWMLGALLLLCNDYFGKYLKTLKILLKCHHFIHWLMLLTMRMCVIVPAIGIILRNRSIQRLEGIFSLLTKNKAGRTVCYSVSLDNTFLHVSIILQRGHNLTNCPCRFWITAAFF